MWYLSVQFVKAKTISFSIIMLFDATTICFQVFDFFLKAFIVLWEKSTVVCVCVHACTHMHGVDKGCLSCRGEEIRFEDNFPLLCPALYITLGKFIGPDKIVSTSLWISPSHICKKCEGRDRFPHFLFLHMPSAEPAFSTPIHAMWSSPPGSVWLLQKWMHDSDPGNPFAKWVKNSCL